MANSIKINKVKLDSRNTNKHTKQGLVALNSSVEQVGVIEAITISNDDVVISGNARHGVIGKKLGKDAILIETDGTQAIYIKRTDIESGTKEFHKASILANTVAQANQDFDVELIEELAEEFEFELEEVFVEVETNNENEEEDDEDEDEEVEKTYSENKYPLSIVLNKGDMIKWNEIKEKLNLIQDTNAFKKIIEIYKTKEND